jgi:uncharacterized SAM-binding protein YcdF (DUF218 family)/glycosyltransferase involved in cell wall biosynthesis
MIRRPDILCVSSIDWDFIWQGHQEIMSRLAADGHRVLFIENTGVRPPRVSDLPRVRQRLHNWWRGTKGFRTERPNLVVFSPLVMPLPYSRLARWVNRVILRRTLQRWMNATGFSRPIVWTFLPTPLARDVIRDVQPSLTIYYCIDDLASSSPEARKITPSEQELFRDADLVFVTSEKLRQRAAAFSNRVHLFPFGVSLATFEKVRDEAPAVPDDLATLKRPIVGYVGGLHQWVDQELVCETAKRLPHVTFAFVGPAQVDVQRLQALPNIVLLGKREHAQVPHYVRGFDTAIVPYTLSEYTSNVYPTKLNEYLSMGVPVVATDLAEIRRFHGEHGDVIAVGHTAPEFAAAIEKSLCDHSAERRARRIDVARSNSWERRIEQMSQLIDEAMTARDAAGDRWEERLRRLYRTARRRTLQVAVATAAAYLLLFYTPLTWMVAEPLRLSAPPGPADAIVVFAGGVGESGKAGGGAQERVKRAVELYHAGHASRVIFSTGYVFSFPEAEVMRAVAMDNGVPASAILLEEEAKNTYENVERSRRILDQHGWRRVLLVSSPYHMRRALLTWKKVAPHIEVVPTPPAESQFYSHATGASLEQIQAILHEYGAIVVYWRRGWI